jgi:hypothetical protein
MALTDAGVLAPVVSTAAGRMVLRPLASMSHTVARAADVILKLR